VQLQVCHPFAFNLDSVFTVSLETAITFLEFLLTTLESDQAVRHRSATPCLTANHAACARKAALCPTYACFVRVRLGFTVLSSQAQCMNISSAATTLEAWRTVAAKTKSSTVRSVLLRCTSCMVWRTLFPCISVDSTFQVASFLVTREAVSEFAYLVEPRDETFVRQLPVAQAWISVKDWIAAHDAGAALRQIFRDLRTSCTSDAGRVLNLDSLRTTVQAMLAQIT